MKRFKTKDQIRDQYRFQCQVLTDTLDLIRLQISKQIGHQTIENKVWDQTQNQMWAEIGYQIEHQINSLVE